MTLLSGGNHNDRLDVEIDEDGTNQEIQFRIAYQAQIGSGQCMHHSATNRRGLLSSVLSHSLLFSGKSRKLNYILTLVLLQRSHPLPLKQATQLQTSPKSSKIVNDTPPISAIYLQIGDIYLQNELLLVTIQGLLLDKYLYMTSVMEDY